MSTGYSPDSIWSRQRLVRYGMSALCAVVCLCAALWGSVPACAGMGALAAPAGHVQVGGQPAQAALDMAHIWETVALFGEPDALHGTASHRVPQTRLRHLAAVFMGIFVVLGVFVFTHYRATRIRREVEDRLRRREREYRVLVENIPSVVYRCVNDEDWTMRYLSDRAEALTGYAATDLLGSVRRSYGSIIHPDDRQAVADGVAAGLDYDGRFTLEYRIVTASGGEKWIYEIGQGVRGDDGEYRVLVGTLTDVTDRKLATAALQRKAQEYARVVEERELLLSSMRDFVYRHNRDGVFEYVSPSVEAVLGYKPEEFRVHYRQTLTDSPLNAKVEEQTRQALTTGIAQPPYLAEMEHRDGSRRVMEVSERPIMRDGLAIGMVGVARDATERVHAANEIERLRKLLANIVNSMPSVLVGVDGDGVVTQWNRQAERETGTSAEEAIGQSIEAVFPRIQRQMDRVRKALREREVQASSKAASIHNGRTVYEDVTVYPLVTNGVEGAVIRIDDVTERVRIEEMMIQTEKMLSVGGLAAGMAHEINNPLGIILQSAQNLERRMSPDLVRNVEVAQECGVDLAAVQRYMIERRVDTYVAAIKEAGQRAARIVHNMLDFSRKSESALAPCDINALLDRVVELASSDYDLKKRYDFKLIEIVREYQDGLPDIVCTQTEIEQVILNLLKNAAQAMAETTHGRQPRITLRTRQEDDSVRIEVADNGPGLKKEHRKRVFEPFFTTKAPGVGTGLGLSVSYFIISQNHYGTFHVESTEGGGATFVICLPRDREAMARRMKEGKPPQNMFGADEDDPT
ncbi:PAS domain-containing sensor histidine kinase [Desulfobaculum sp.]